MKLIVCLDDRDGMSFGGRRQSSDREVCKHILQLTDGSTLYMQAYSAKLFPEGSVCVCADVFAEAEENAWVFWETGELPAKILPVERVVIYRWNRRYPATQTFPKELLNGLHLTETIEFSGNSHEKITMQRYTL